MIEKKMLRISLTVSLLALALFLFAQCTNYQFKTEDSSGGVASCEGCHTDYSHLMLVYSPDTTAPASGCGGEAPHYEPYERVYMGGSGYEAFRNDPNHYPLGCTGCHNGEDNTSDKTLAHSGDFISHPSAAAAEKCAGCHSGIVSGFATSLHNGTGQKRKVTMRSGLEGPEEFDLLPAHQIEGYNANCATCHGTCGNCHVVRPPIAGGGLSMGHGFNREPDMLNVCVACHTSRGGHAYLGRDPNADPDVHLTSATAGYTCLDCHSGMELHGDGEPVDHRYEYDKLPDCETCHAGIATSNSYHSAHAGDFNCHVCHSQDYNTCGSCHIHGEGARFGPYQDFKIALNPIPDAKTGYEFALVRRTLAAPDNWKEYDVEQYAAFEAFPTYNYTTPHNIQRWTERTNQEGACYLNCHIRNEGGQLVNAELYLWADSLETWEVAATSGITVDGRLPAGWFGK